MPEPRELTRVPVNGPYAFYGSIAFFAVLAYPGVDQVAHARRDRFVAAFSDWMHGWFKHRAGFKRVSARRAQSTENDWIARPQSMKNAAVFRTLNQVEAIVVERRLVAGRIAHHLAGLWAARELGASGSFLKLRIRGPQTLSAAIGELAGHSASGDASTLWRVWRETLPVLHLAYAFDALQPAPAEGDRPGIVVRCVRDHRLWLGKVLESAERRAMTLPQYTAFDPATRVSLRAE